SEVPTATCCVTSASKPSHRSAAESAGTMIAPPPMPSRPAATPETTPVISRPTMKGISPQMLSKSMLFADQMQHHLPAVRPCAMLEEIEPLPRPEDRPATAHGYTH